MTMETELLRDLHNFILLEIWRDFKDCWMLDGWTNILKKDV